MVTILAIQKVDIESDQTTSLEAFVSCRLIHLDRNPGFRPIGIGEVFRRIAGKSIILAIKPQIKKSAGDIQFCAGQPAGCEACNAGNLRRE